MIWDLCRGGRPGCPMYTNQGVCVQCRRAERAVLKIPGPEQWTWRDEDEKRDYKRENPVAECGHAECGFTCERRLLREFAARQRENQLVQVAHLETIEASLEREREISAELRARLARLASQPTKLGVLQPEVVPNRWPHELGQPSAVEEAPPAQPRQRGPIIRYSEED